MNTQLTINQKLNTKLFKDVVKMLNDKEINFWLDRDTLLGVWSSKIINDVSFEKNINISIHQKDLFRLYDALKKLKYIYRVHHYTNISGRQWIPENTVAVGIFNSWKKSARSFKIMISIKYENGNEYRWIDIRNCKYVEKKYYKKLDRADFGGKVYKTPSNIDEYLNRVYGNWRSIPKSWTHQINDGTLASDRQIQRTPELKIQKSDNHKDIKLYESNNHSRMKEMLLYTIDKLAENKIPFWLEAGTLLGIYRDGDLISWDYDADISIPAEYTEKAVSLRSKFFPRFIVRKRPISSRWIPGDTRVVKVKKAWEKLQQVNFHIDLFCVYKVKDKYRWVDSGVLKQVESKYFDSQDTINWEGRNIPIPAHTEEYLTLRYGDWHVPNKNYNAALHDGAIAERGF